MRGTLVLFTATFPFRNFTEEVFLLPEVEALGRDFNKVIVVPLERRGEPIELSWSNIEVDTFIADSLFTKVKVLKSPYLLHHTVVSHYHHLAQESKSITEFLCGAFFCMNAKCFGDLIGKWIETRKLDTSDTLFYTFWFDHITSALAMISEGKGLKIVSRAHGHDVYDTQLPFRSHIFRAYTLDNMLGLYPASDDASGYIKKQYPAYGHKISTRILGSSKIFPEASASPHSASDKEWTFLSCARIEPEKRVDRCFALVKAIATAYPLNRIRWIHAGGGSLMDNLRKEIESVDLPSNLHIDLRGAMDNREVQYIYVSEKIDWSMLLSDSEGGCPITLCESLSYGIPVIATEVGGIPQIITPEVGITVAPDTPAENIVGELQPYLNNPCFYDDLRSGCIERWNRHFNSKTLRSDFSKELTGLITSRP